MSADDMALGHELFDPLAETYLGRPGVDIGRMFGTEGLRVRGKVFAFVGSGGGLIVKVPEARAAELSDSGVAPRMVMRGREMREWVTVAPEAGLDAWAALMAEAFAYLDEITP
ncbi:MAG TPA: TfoX/Sxy family protein [Microbacterium sp.]|uniref:TfoX/Sxy family protein n=1 Tax=Microbacterium sp. TaxID=51671 RepID=UPI002B9AD8BC|nr:TfoX/Sxy family protein [Microbacterium sp.]HWI31835.1 TfoX/Sxy family protein [Microbacterium sp.]